MPIPTVHVFAASIEIVARKFKADQQAVFRDFAASSFFCLFLQPLRLVCRSLHTRSCALRGISFIGASSVLA